MKSKRRRIILLALSLLLCLTPLSSVLAANLPFRAEAPRYFLEEDQVITIPFTNQSAAPILLRDLDTRLESQAKSPYKITQVRLQNVEADPSDLTLVGGEKAVPAGGQFYAHLTFSTNQPLRQKALRPLPPAPASIQAQKAFARLLGTSSFQVGRNLAFTLYLGQPKTKAGQAYEGPHYEQPKRLGGSSRYETAVTVSRNTFSKASGLVIARGDDFADALTASPLAAALGGPILLTQTKRLPAAVGQEIKRLGAKKIVIVGGPNAVSQSVEKALSAYGKVERIQGANRFETCAAIARALKKAGKNFHQAFFATSTNFVDALAISPLAGLHGLPILLVDKKQVPAPIAQVVKELSIRQSVLVGGVHVIPQKLAARLPGSKQRFAGATRYETATLIAQNFPKLRRAYLATGANYPDALAAGPVCARLAAPILLVERDALPAVVRSFLMARPDLSDYYLVGGPTVLSESLATELRLQKWVQENLGH